MKIYLKIGIDNLRFGMTRSEVKEIIGKQSLEIIDSDENNELIWEYADLKLRLTFYQNEADRLGYFRSSNSNLKINGSRIIDSRIEKIKSQIDPNPESWEKEEYDSFNTYFLKSDWLTLYVEYERVTDIELGVPFKNEDEYDWPK
jgi:hypothetical protein